MTFSLPHSKTALFPSSRPQDCRTSRLSFTIQNSQFSILNSSAAPCTSCEEAADQAHGIAVLTEWDEFREVDFDQVLGGMFKPAYIFDGRDILDHAALRTLGFDVYAIGKG